MKAHSILKLTILSVLFLSSLSACKEDDDTPCECIGRFSNDGGNTIFFGNSVDCDTGSPVIDNNPEALYLGCDG